MPYHSFCSIMWSNRRPRRSWASWISAAQTHSDVTDSPTVIPVKRLGPQCVSQPITRPHGLNQTSIPDSPIVVSLYPGGNATLKCHILPNWTSEEHTTDIPTLRHFLTASILSKKKLTNTNG